jgi:hypothetical protein
MLIKKSKISKKIQKSPKSPLKSSISADFTKGALQNDPAAENEASVDARIEQRFGQRRKSRLKQNPLLISLCPFVPLFL